ncbi:MAG: hypothetical protein ACKO8V_01415 [Actinomycetota bacterium]
MTRYTSSTGKDFTQVSALLVPTSACKNADGAAAGFLGDPQVVKVASGYLAYAQEMGAGKSAPFKRQACKMTSADGNTWSIDSSGTFAFNYDIRNNPELYRNSAGQLELWFSEDNAGSKTKTSEIRTSSNDGASIRRRLRSRGWPMTLNGSISPTGHRYSRSETSTSDEADSSRCRRKSRVVIRRVVMKRSTKFLGLSRVPSKPTSR